MKTFYISVTEVKTKFVEVHADSKEEAITKAKTAYENGEVSLEEEQVFSTDFSDETEEVVYNYEFGGMPKFYEIY